MNIEKLGDIFADGRMINLDSASIDVLDQTIEKVNEQREDKMKAINNLLVKIQN